MKKLRLYKSPIVGDGKTPETALRPKAAALGFEHTSLIPKGATIAISLIRAENFSLLDSDPEIERLNKKQATKLASELYGANGVNSLCSLTKEGKGWNQVEEVVT